MSDLTAIDILANPDGAAIERAKQINDRMRQSVSTSLPSTWMTRVE